MPKFEAPITLPAAPTADLQAATKKYVDDNAGGGGGGGGAAGESWDTYTPTWTAATTNPAIGNGTIEGRYSQNGKTVHGYVRIKAGSTTTFGSGGWRVSLPVQPRTALDTTEAYAVGTAYYENDGIQGYTNGAQCRLRHNGTTWVLDMIYNNAEVTSSNPFSWGTDDYVILEFTYEAETAASTGAEWAYDPTDNSDAADINWDGTQVSGMTTVTVSGSQTLTEKTGVLSALYQGQGTQDYNALLASHTFSVGDAFAVPIRLFGGDAGIASVGIIFTDGTTSSANAVAAHMQQHSSEDNCRLYTRHGTLTLMNSTSAQTNTRGGNLPWLWLKLTYQAANTFRKEVSPDGISWDNVGVSDVSKTMTPSHFGICWSVDNQSGTAIATFGPILKVA